MCHILLAVCCALKAGDTIFFSSPGYHPLIVPSGTSYVQIYLRGACGGPKSPYSGGLGGTLNATIYGISWGTNLTIIVGSKGTTSCSSSSGFNGGGLCNSGGGAGGGATDIRYHNMSIHSRIAVAGGGGGAG